jgi:hypothetical protein
MTENNLIDIILGVILGVVAHRLYITWVAVKMLEELQSRLDQVREKPEVKPIDAKIEQIGNSLYMYRVDNEEFLGQGQTFQELTQQIVSRFRNPDMTFRIIQGDPELLKQIKQQL